MKFKTIVKKIINERNKYQSLMFNHILQESLFRGSLNENADNNKREDVLDKIRKGDWEKPQNPESFKNSMELSTRKEMLTQYSVGELKQMELYKLDGYNIGFALKKRDDGSKEIVAVHNNEPDVKSVGADLVKAAVSLGGCYLDHFDGHLSDFYSKLGFVEYDRDLFDPQYDEDGSFRAKYGESDVIYRKHKNCK
jgi:hypothetical protein